MSKLFVYGVNQNCPRTVLEDEFTRCGEVTDVYITGKGYAFVTMADEAGADEAIRTLNGAMVDGQEIKVDQARRRDDGGGRGRGGYGGGYGGGRGGGGYGGGGFGGGRGGGGFGGGRGGRGGSRACYNCNEEGHIARECPQGGNQGGGY